MKRLLSLTFVALALVAIGLAPAASAGDKWGWGIGCARNSAVPCTAASTCWHGGYYEAGWGSPVALVVPPTAEFQTKWGWGVGNTRVTPIYHQFGRNYPGPYVPNVGFLPTPLWPSDTDQFGVYYVRGPW